MIKAVRINVKNVHMAEITEQEGSLQFGTPELAAGAMDIGSVPQIASGKLYGDGKVSHSTNKKNAYDITLNHNRLPNKWRRYMEGVKVTDGVESGTSDDEPKPFAIGWEVEQTEGTSELIWFLYGTAQPVEKTVKQSEDNINYSTDTVKITAIEHDSLKRYYTLIDTADEEITEKMASDFFKKVQTTDVISAT